MHDTAYADAIEDRLADALSTIEEHWDGMTTRPALRPRGGRRPAPQSRPPVSAGITEVRATCQARMRSLGQALMEAHPDTPPPPADAYGPTLAMWLWENVAPLSTVADAGDADELASSARQVLHHAAPTRPDWMRIGACPLMLEDGSTCGGEVRGWPHHTDEDGAAWCRCEACGTQAVASWWEAQGMGATGVVLTTEEVRVLAHEEFGVTLTPQAVRMWVSRGTVRPIQPGARPLTFHRSEVVRHLAASA
ncbi:hypothetical protein ACH0CA_01390 [Kytococcus sedentarius]|uniref:hypothetical protein n=1 Tax=Kytococcus sedentarius TaxID=1276 RepID=UPI00387A12F6